MWSPSRKSAAFGLVVLAVGCAAVILGPAGDATAEQDEVSALVALCNSPIGYHRKAMAIDTLLAMDSGSGRSAIADLAGSSDDRVAVLALAAMGRGDYSGARSTLLTCLADGDRSDIARTAALTAWCRLRKDDQASWASVNSAVSEAVSGNDRLTAALAAVQSKLWGDGGGE